MKLICALSREKTCAHGNGAWFERSGLMKRLMAPAISDNRLKLRQISETFRSCGSAKVLKKDKSRSNILRRFRYGRAST